MIFQCCLCDENVVGVPHIYREKPICEVCWEAFKAEVNAKIEEEITCADCGIILNGWRSTYTIEHDTYCFMCWKRKTESNIVRCSDCGKVLPSIALKYTIDGKVYCGPCGEKVQQRKRSNPFGFSNGARAGCAQCGKQPETVCTHCNKPFCRMCYVTHDKPKEEPTCTHYYRTDWDMPGEDIISELLRRYGVGGMGSRPNPGSTANKQSSSSSSSTQTRYVSAEVREAFKVLGITPEATVKEIEKAYKAKAKLYHPETVAYVLEGDRYVPSPHSDTIKTQEMVKLNKAKEATLKHAGGK